MAGLRWIEVAAATALSIGICAGGAAALEAPKEFKPNNGCRNTGPGFEPWLAAFRKEAAQKGVSARTVSIALDGMSLDQNIINTDRGQSFFSQSFLSFSDKLATRNRVDSGQRALQRHKAIFDKAEKQYGVASAVIAAFWALESDFGVGMGKKPVLRSLATLAWDCRRGEMFREELLAALKIIDRGDLQPSDMVGSWAGELGQTQFLPTHYFNYAVDFDGDGRRDLMRSNADVIGSSANFLANLGWQKGQPWLEEVRVPGNLAWDQAGLDIQQPRAYWSKAGVTLANGRPLPADAQKASLVLLMGRNGPAFLAYDNFQIFLKWNQSLNYATTAAYLANRISGTAPMGRGQLVAVLETNALKDLQASLARAGFYKGEQDGRLGAGTRAAVKQAQIKLGLPADSYPTPDLAERLRGRR